MLFVGPLVVRGFKVPLFYKSPKFLKVDEVPIAMLFKFLQAAALAVSLLPLLYGNAWALTERPGGTINAWDGAGSMEIATDDTALASRTSYCSSPANVYSKGRREFLSPACRALLPVELTKRTALPPSVFYTTAYTDTVTKGWPCANDPNGTREDGCKSGGGFYFGRRNGQCGCVSIQTVYPLAVEGMLLSFEHSFSVPESPSIQNWFGSSAQKDEVEVEDGGLWSDVALGNGSSLRFGAGEPLELSVEDWLKTANATLDEANEAVQPDSNGNLASRRSTGVSLKVDIVYSNMDPNTLRAVPGKRSVHAKVSVTRKPATWTGIGRETSVIVQPAYPRSKPSDFHLVERDRQGIIFRFQVTGEVYVLDLFVILNVIVRALVTMSLAKVAVDAYTFYLLPTKRGCPVGLGSEKSMMLRNKRQELVSKRSEFAEIGMKAALAATVYRNFDPDNNGSIEPVDIVKAFASVHQSDGSPWVTMDKAHAIAHMILADADTDAEKEGGDVGLSFAEFMSCLEGDAIDFEAFLKGLEHKEDESDREQCRLAYEEERAKLPQVVKGPRTVQAPPVVKLEQTPLERDKRLNAKGMLRLHVQRANGLKPVDANGKADPYVLALLGKTELRSGTAFKTLDPVWEETLEFRKAPSLERVVKKGLKLQLKDQDNGVFDSDDLIAKVKVSLESLADHDVAAFEEKLKPQGTVSFWVTWQPLTKETV